MRFIVVVVFWNFLTDFVVGQNSHPVGKFENGLQQQDFITVLNAIEERLRNLDNVYSMQLSKTLGSKLDMYSRKLETLDTKIIRLEALVMLNLDKISENISTKNFKDDITKTNYNRKIDGIYESVTNRLGYIERKIDQVQEKLDSTTKILGKIEETLTTEPENELSEAIFAIDEMKNHCNSFQEKILNVTSATLNLTRDGFDFIKKHGVDTKKGMNRLHDNLVGNLQYMDNKTEYHVKLTKESNEMLRKMNLELKEDFNNYANKVADMNSDIWKSSDVTEIDLKAISTVLNITRVEIQNGMRNLLVQLGKMSYKGNFTDFDKIDRKLSENFEKILTNQNMFTNSCYRLQMDEAQIENEISVILEKFIDMLEKKLASESKNLKGIEKALKTHDGRVMRNIHQTNSNIMSLYEKYNSNTQKLNEELKQIEHYINAVLNIIQHNNNEQPEEIVTQLRNISALIRSISVEKTTETNKIFDLLRELKGATGKNSTEENLEGLINEIFGTPPPGPTIGDSMGKICENCTNKRKKNRQNFRKFIDVRNGGNDDDYDVIETTTETTTEGGVSTTTGSDGVI